MKVLIINGSQRENGNTERFADFAKKVMNSRGNEVEVLSLLKNQFELCDGCLICEETGQCIINDHFTSQIVNKLQSADMYIFASPTYFNMPTTLFKNFIDRTNCLCEYFENNTKKAVGFIVGQADIESLESSYKCFGEYFEIMGFDVIGNPIMRIARDQNELKLAEIEEEIILSWCK